MHIKHWYKKMGMVYAGAFCILDHASFLEQMPDSLRIIAYQPTDQAHIQCIKQLCAENVHTLHCSASPHASPEQTEYYTQELITFFNQSTYQNVLIHNDIPRGIIAYQKNWINLLAIDSEYRKRGFGSHLLKHSLKALEQEGVQTIGLYVKKTNKSAQRVYTKHGFEYVDSSCSESAITMILTRGASSAL